MGKGLPRSLKNAGVEQNSVRKLTIPLDDVVVTVSATGSAIGFGSAVIRGLPEGNVQLIGAVAFVGLSGSGSDANLAATWSGDYGIGTTPASDATISGTDVNIIGSTAIGPATAEAIAPVRAANDTPAIFDNTDGSLELNLNVLVDAANIVDDESVDLTASGYLSLAYVVLGDD